MALLVGTVVAERLETMSTLSREALAAGCDMAELRLDTLASREPGVETVAGQLPAGHWIATCRPASEGGQSRASVEHRLPILLSAVRAGAALVDVELSAWQRFGMARHDLVKALADSSATGHGRGLLISHHDFDGRPADLNQIVDEMRAIEEASAIKIAWRADDILSNFDALDIMYHGRGESIAICMGEAGLMSRVLPGKCGAFAAYCALDAESKAAPGQLTVAELRERYRWDSIDEATEVYGVIGNPVAQSVGPDVFNDAFRAEKVNGVYLPFLVPPDERSFAAFLDACIDRPWLDVRGLSVTAPHKVHALRYLGDRVDPPADMIGAVNTIRIEDGEVWGCNTDCDAALDTLLAAMQCDVEDLDGVPVDVLGAGGVARAVVAGLADCGCTVTVYNRDPQRAQSLADMTECVLRPWEDRDKSEGKVLVNCTSVGMHPDADSTPMPVEALRSGTVVFDTVYRPRETRLLRDASAAGCVTVGGFGMFVRQAGMQFEYWTHHPADYERMEAVVERLC